MGRQGNQLLRPAKGDARSVEGGIMRKFFESGLVFMLVALVWMRLGLLSGRPGWGALGSVLASTSDSRESEEHQEAATHT